MRSSTHAHTYMSIMSVCAFVYPVPSSPSCCVARGAGSPGFWLSVFSFVDICKAGLCYPVAEAALKGTFDKLLCDPKDACNIRPLHVTTLLSNMTLKDLLHHSRDL